MIVLWRFVNKIGDLMAENVQQMYYKLYVSKWLGMLLIERLIDCCFNVQKVMNEKLVLTFSVREIKF